MREHIDFTEAPYCAVGEYKNGGQALFALKSFDIGEEVANYSSTIPKCIRVKFEDIPPEHLDMCWWVGLSEDIACLFPRDSVFMRANHSSNPNTKWFPLEYKLVASQIINVGDEITFDYRLEIAPPSVKNHPPIWAI